jgi:RHS repeat-associated protein
VIDSLGNLNQTVYDTNNNVIATIDPYGNKIQYTYDSNGNKLETIDPYGNITKNTYDANNNLLETINAVGQSNRWAYNTSGNMISSTDGNGAATIYAYDADNRLISITDPLGNTATSTYDGNNNVLSMTNQLGNTTSYIYNSNNNQVAMIDALKYTTYMQYDAVGNMISAVDANGHTTSFAYDADNRNISLTDPYGNITKYTYDRVSNLLSTINPDGSTIVSTFDALHRELTRFQSDGTQYRFTYDHNGNTLSETNTLGPTNYAYDANGNLIQTTIPSGSTLSYKYDKNYNRIQMTDMNGGITTYTYDEGQNQTTITNSLGETTTFEYDGAGNLISTVHANGITAVISFDLAEREVLRTETNAGGTAIAQFASTYDAAGNRLTLTEVDGSITTYAYNATRQLISEVRVGTNPYSVSYTYDPLGNRLTKIEGEDEITTYAYGSANEILGATPNNGTATTYAYDTLGRLITETTGSDVTKRTWDAASRLTGIMLGTGARETNVYNADGMRVAKTASGTLSNYVIDGLNILAELNSSGDTSSIWTYMSNGGGTLLSENRNSSTVHFVFDPNSNTRALVNSSGIIATAFLTDSFGVEENATGISSETPFRFAGKFGYWREDSDRIYVRARHYSPITGRWATRDPILFNGGDMNLYRYVGNMVTVLTDASGLDRPCQYNVPGTARGKSCKTYKDYKDTMCDVPRSCVAISADCSNCSTLLSRVQANANCARARQVSDEICGCIPYSIYTGHGQALTNVNLALLLCQAKADVACADPRHSSTSSSFSPTNIPLAPIIIIVGVGIAACLLCPECCAVGVGALA